MTENEIIAKTYCTNICTQFNEVVQKLVRIRKEAGLSQQFIAEWLKVDRRKIIALENGKLFDIILLEKYCDRFGLNLYINATD